MPARSRAILFFFQVLASASVVSQDTQACLDLRAFAVSAPDSLKALPLPLTRFPHFPQVSSHVTCAEPPSLKQHYTVELSTMMEMVCSLCYPVKVAPSHMWQLST